MPDERETEPEEEEEALKDLDVEEGADQVTGGARLVCNPCAGCE